MWYYRMNKVLLCFLLLVIVTCKKPDDEPEPTASTHIVIDDFADDADTISATWHSSMKVSIIGAQFPKYMLKVFVKNTLMRWDSSYTGGFQVPTDDLFNFTGFIPCWFEVYGGASSQTFLQIMNKGQLVNKRQVVVDFSGFNRIPEPILEERNGTLEGHFNTMLRIDALAVYRYYNNGNLSYRVDSVIANGKGEIKFTDHGYVGEKTYYLFKGYSFYDSTELTYSGSGSMNKSREIVPHEVFSDANGCPVIKCNKNRYHQNFDRYRIRMQKGSTGSTLVKEITDINDTVQTTLDLGFPGSVNIYVTHLPRETLQYIQPDTEMEDYGNKVAYQPGNPIRSFNLCESPVGDDINLYLNNGAYISRYSAISFQKVDSIYCASGRFSVSANNKYVATLRNDRFHLYNVATRQDISILISDFLPIATVNDFEVSDNGTIAVMNDFDNLKLIDVLNNKLLGALPMYNFTLNLCQISPQGDYVYVYTESKNRIYKFSGGTFTEVFNTGETGFNSLKFVADQYGKVLLIRPGKYEIYDLVAGNITFSAPLPSYLEISIDFNVGLILTEEEYGYKIYDIGSGMVVKSIGHYIDYSNYHKTSLHGRTLLNGIGRWMTFTED